jgi:hypothetical protein
MEEGEGEGEKGIEGEEKVEEEEWKGRQEERRGREEKRENRFLEEVPNHGTSTLSIPSSRRLSVRVKERGLIMSESLLILLPLPQVSPPQFIFFFTKKNKADEFVAKHFNLL